MLISDEKTVCDRAAEIVRAWAEANDIRTTAEGINPASEGRRGLAFSAEKIVNDGLARRYAQSLIGSVLATVHSETKLSSDIKRFRIERTNDAAVPPDEESLCVTFYL